MISLVSNDYLNNVSQINSLKRLVYYYVKLYLNKMCFNELLFLCQLPYQQNI